MCIALAERRVPGEKAKQSRLWPNEIMITSDGCVLTLPSISYMNQPLKSKSCLCALTNRAAALATAGAEASAVGDAVALVADEGVATVEEAEADFEDEKVGEAAATIETEVAIVHLPASALAAVAAAVGVVLADDANSY